MKPMKPLPFIIHKFVFQDDPAVQHFGEPTAAAKGALADPLKPCFQEKVDDPRDNRAVRLINSLDATPQPVPVSGYFVMSNAPPNIEEAVELKPVDLENAARGIDDIADDLYRIYRQTQMAPELVVTVHGYNTSLGSVQNWYKDIFQYANRYDTAISAQSNKVFIGYRWPSENIEPQRLGEAFQALPPLPRDILIGGGLGAIALLILQFSPLEETIAGIALALLLAVFVLLGSLMLALVALRLVVYFRDTYRANNFGVADLVELIRLLDSGLIARQARDLEAANPDHPNVHKAAANQWHESPRKVRLSFIGHSMGGFVVTNAVRILSDVFDSRSIDRQPPPDIGCVFRLERLLLASPDIPVLTIISSRANVLDSSLRRFAESYLFSSEGDIALRIASTAANYIAFPSRTQSRGYRLGNVALRSRYGILSDYGVLNLTSLDQNLIPGASLSEAIERSPDKVLDLLFLTSQRYVKDGYITLGKLFEAQSNRDKNQVTVADFFTFFDCTDYKDLTFSVREHRFSAEPTGILTRAKAKGPLNSFDYFLLTLDYISKKRDVHGGYFVGDLSQQLLYRTAFLGFTGYLKTLDTDTQTAFDPHVALSKLHMQCREKGIQAFLSPIRYRVDIQGHSLQDTQGKMLEAMQQEVLLPSDPAAPQSATVVE
jgi:Alpha/beta hydrolase of unknown function (DUF900)